MARLSAACLALNRAPRPQGRDPDLLLRLALSSHGHAAYQVEHWQRGGHKQECALLAAERQQRSSGGSGGAASGRSAGTNGWSS